MGFRVVKIFVMLSINLKNLQSQYIFYPLTKGVKGSENWDKILH
jgi:hypothetical protein